MLKGKVAFITGAGRGIGQAIAMSLSRGGADIVGIGLNLDKLKSSMKLVEETTGRKAIAIQADVSDALSIDNALKDAINLFGHIDILVNNAGITRDNILLRMKDEEWETVIKTNLTGTFNCTKSVIKNMVKNRKGRIINITSIVGVMGNVGQANYAASKAGIIGFTKSIAREYANRGITANAIAPGFIETDMTKAMTEESRKGLINQIPMGRLGKPEDVANFVSFLSSDEADYITGQVIHINGGMYM